MCRLGLAFGGFLSLWASAVAPAGAQQLTLKREYPGSGPYVCAPEVAVAVPTDDERGRAGQLASDANQAMILGEFDRVETLLAQAVELDPTSADLAYRRARILEELERGDAAMREYCRVIDLGGEAIGLVDARQRIDALYDQIRARLPRAAREAFLAGLVAADDSLFLESIDHFSVAIELAPDWPDPIYNRALIREHIGQLQAALVDFRAYLDVVSDPEDADAIAISARIGQLEGAASVSTPSPSGTLALGVIPGMGHYYSRRPVPGTITLVTAGAAIAAGFMFTEVTTYCVDEVPPGAGCAPLSVVDEVTERPYLWIGVGIGAAITLAGAVEAYLKAKSARAETEAITGGSESGLNVGFPTVSTQGDRVDLSFVRYRFW
jgi:tetratricopeptide (TPR) repeat protein